MNTKSVFAALFFAALSSASAETVAVSSTVSAVTVYGDRAAVTRVGQVSLQPGSYVLSFRDLPVTLLEQSVRVAGEAAGAKILDVRVETTFLDTIPEERIRTLQSKIQELQTQQNEMNDRLSVLATERDFITQIKAQTADNISRDLKIQRPTVEDWQKILAFFDMNLNKNFAEQRKLLKDRGDVQGKIDALQRQLGQISPGSRRTVKNILVAVQVVRGGTVKLSPTYVVLGARWYPEYDVRVATESQAVEMTYAGFVQQSTGEDWNNADVTLSTARPDIGGVKPELSPWFLTVAQPVHVMQKRAATDALSLSAMPSGAGAPTAMEVPTAEVETQDISALFHITAPSTIPSDNVPHKLTIAIEKLHADFSYSSVPKLSPFVYLKAVITNTTEAPFLPGSVNVFSNDAFVATSFMKMIAPNETFDAYLGTDPSITIERRLVNKFTDYTGTFTKNVRVTYEFSFALTNMRKIEEKVVVQDQIPLSQNEKILVEQVEPAEKEMRRDDKGFLTWTVTVKPSEKKTWKLKFTIEYPQGVTISGLE